MTPATATTSCIARFADSLTGPRCVPCFVWLIPARSESAYAILARRLALLPTRQLLIGPNITCILGHRSCSH